MEIPGRKAIVVGGASGMARATAEMFVAKGGQVAILDRPQSQGAEVAKLLNAPFFACDVTDFAASEKAVRDAAAALGGVHFCVNTAGGGVAMRTLAKDGPHALDAFRKVIDLNLIASFNVARIAAHCMSTNAPDENGERGVILMTASIAAFEGQIGQVAYTAAKAGIAGMTFTMARARTCDSNTTRCDAVVKAFQRACGFQYFLAHGVRLRYFFKYDLHRNLHHSLPRFHD